MVQWLRTCLPMQGTKVQFLGWVTKIPHAMGQLSPHVPQLEKIRVLQKRQHTKKEPPYCSEQSTISLYLIVYKTYCPSCLRAAMMEHLGNSPNFLSEEDPGPKAINGDFQSDTALWVDISDSLSERDKVKFTVHTKSSLPNFK